MLNRKVAFRCAGAVVAATVVLLSAAERAITQERGTAVSPLSSLLPPAASSSELDSDHHDDDGESTEGCEAPYYAIVPERRHRVEAPSEGTVAGNVRAVYEDMSAGILKRWGAEYEDTLFSDAMAWGADGRQVVKDKMLNAVLEQDSFVAAFTGNSIAAGHDCLYEQSYPILLNATMGRLMAAAGVGYTAINVAMGNTRAAPYSYCVDAHAGLDADIVSWSFVSAIIKQNTLRSSTTPSI